MNMNKDQKARLFELERASDMAFHRASSLRFSLQRELETYNKTKQLLEEATDNVYKTKSELIEFKVSCGIY